MSLVCQVCGKKSMHGQSIRHKHSKGWKYRAPNTKKIWKPNLRKVKIQKKDGTTVIVKMCMACYKKYSSEGLAYINKKKASLYKKLSS